MRIFALVLFGLALAAEDGRAQMQKFAVQYAFESPDVPAAVRRDALPDGCVGISFRARLIPMNVYGSPISGQAGLALHFLPPRCWPAASTTAMTKLRLSPVNSTHAQMPTRPQRADERPGPPLPVD
jgi:hypothetical protein